MCTTNTTGNDLGLTDKNHACACGTHNDNTESRASETAGVVREHYLVGGMTCAHCVASVTEEVSAIAGVESVSVDLDAGGTSRIMVVSSHPVTAGDVEAAIVEAGYTLVTA
jgi:copper chaperone